MAVALVSLLTGIPVRSDVAMSGEISLSGRLLAIGGLREKILAAVGAGLKRALIPGQNRDEVSEFPPHVAERIEIEGLTTIEQALASALVEPLPGGAGRRKAKPGKEKKAGWRQASSPASTRGA